MKIDLLRVLSSAGRNLVVLQNPVDVDRIRALSGVRLRSGPEYVRSANSEAIQLVGAGRLVRQKGFDLLIEALALTSSRFEATILGDGALRGELERLAKDLGVASRVHFMGFQSNPYPFFRYADAFVLSSRFEGMPNVVLEALACGTGVISTPAPGGVNELLEGRPRCVIAKSISARSLAEAIQGYDFSDRGPKADFALSEFMAESICGRYADVLLSAARDRN
jgi:glycosyltransferase involved in cell wall biosynthesis